LLNLKRIFVGEYLTISVFLLTIALIRTNKPDVKTLATIYKTIQFILFIVFLVVFYNWYLIKKKRNAFELIINGTILPFSIYCVINIICWILGVKFEGFEELEIGKSVTLGLFGLDVDRVKFPFVQGINSFASVVGSVFTISLIALSHAKSKQSRTILIFSICVLVIVLFLTDSRASLFYPILILLGVKAIRMFNFKKILSIFPFFPLVGPFIIVIALSLIAQSGAFEAVSRNSEETATGNGRLVIWGIALNEFLNFQLIHLIGYGEFGHYASKASFAWAHLFEKWSNGELTHPHNTVLMIIFDYGYLGLLYFILFLKNVAKNIKIQWERNIYLTDVALGFMIYFVLIGTTESFYGFYYLNSIYIFFSISLIILINNKLNITQP
jgi:O-antigen ligase